MFRSIKSSNTTSTIIPYTIGLVIYMHHMHICTISELYYLVIELVIYHEPSNTIKLFTTHLVFRQTQARYLQVVHLRQLQGVPGLLCETNRAFYCVFIVISLLLLHSALQFGRQLTGNWQIGKLPRTNCFARGRGLLCAEEPSDILMTRKGPS